MSYKLPPILPADPVAYAKLEEVMRLWEETTLQGKWNKCKRVWRAWLVSVWHDIADPLW